jgi:hypothetical protein
MSAKKFQLTDNLEKIPESKRLLLKELVAQLSKIPGMVAIVLAGSYASGTHKECWM